ncbi:hypothetical protein JW968_06570 [Candidatus Woesearchaeota archaeon]|nr:hypothetical protein [Candidatus Woesearchaeota archaeon]
MPKVIVNNGQYKITIPKELALQKGWDSKTRLMFIQNEKGEIILKEVKLDEK